jgi:hypothetical protein
MEKSMKTRLINLRMLAVLAMLALACNFLSGVGQATPTLRVLVPTISPPTLQVSTATVAASFSPSTGDPYIDKVVSFTPGNPVNPDLGKTESVLGSRDFNESTLSGFLNLGVGGIIVVEFVDNVAVDGPGDDIEIFGDPYNDEQWIVEASADCVSYKSFGQVGERVTLDLATIGLTSARCIRISDKGLGGPGAASPGTELDAIEALNSSAP